jgi:opacity protein-like surface antigen
VQYPCQNRTLTVIIIGLMIMVTALAAPPKVRALDTGQTLEITVVPAASFLAVAGAGYLYYKNRYSQPANAKGELGYPGPGEFFVGSFLGAGFIPNTTWDYRTPSPSPLNTAASSMKIDPGITGGIKLGYFFDSAPNLGIEAEGSIGTQHQPSQSVSLNPAIHWSTTGSVKSQDMLVWTMAFHFLGRWGFFQTPEVPFGRLQPYVGLGPGLVMLYAPADSAKNFSLEFEAGLRYMFTKNLGGFVEYKLSQQWQVELESQQLFLNNFGFTASKAVFNVTRNQIVLGLSYHF